MTAVPPADLLSPADEARLFWRLRRRVLHNLISRSLQGQRLRLGLGIGLALLLWGGLFLLFAEGFQFLRQTIDDRAIHDQTVRAVYNVFFYSLFVMLFLSAGIVLYGSLFRSAEVQFLLTTPVRSSRIFEHKFQEATFFTSWAFLLLGSPLLLAYGIVHAAPWTYYLLCLPLMLAFVCIPCAGGAIACLLIARLLPVHRFPYAALGAVVLLGLAALSWWLLSVKFGSFLTPEWFEQLLARLRFSENRLLPSWWLSTALLEAASNAPAAAGGRAPLTESLFFLALLFSQALFFHQVALFVAMRAYRPAYHALAGGRSGRSVRPDHWLDRLALRAAWPLSGPLRLLVLKDVRQFRRDPVQWSQFLIFVGLLGMYFLNTRWLRFEVHYAGWINLIGFLNLLVVGLILSTFTTRFIFPLLSLEGRRLWILGLLPIERDAVLWGKLVYAAGGATPPALLLVLLSDLMLQARPLIAAVHVLDCALMAVGLSAIAVGLGARFPLLREESPARIASGFGGTLNLICSTAFLIGLLAATAAPAHLLTAVQEAPLRLPAWIVRTAGTWLAVGTPAAILLTVLASTAALRAGLRAFRRLEY